MTLATVLFLKTEGSTTLSASSCTLYVLLNIEENGGRADRTDSSTCLFPTSPGVRRIMPIMRVRTSSLDKPVTYCASQKATGSIERDENYVPYTRKQFKLPSEKMAKRRDYEEIFGETPIYTLGGLLIMQFL